jgi:hypothetical protein
MGFIERQPKTDFEKMQETRDEGKRGFLRIPQDQLIDIGDQRLEDLFESIYLQIYGKYFDETGRYTEYYAYCPLFAPMAMGEETPNYTMRVTFEEPGPVIEILRRVI